MTEKTYIAADGTALTEELIERMAAEAEDVNSCEFVDEPAPWRTREPMETHSVRVPAALWRLVEQEADRRGLSVAAYTRLALSMSLEEPAA